MTIQASHRDAVQEADGFELELARTEQIRVLIVAVLLIAIMASQLVLMFHQYRGEIVALRWLVPAFLFVLVLTELVMWRTIRRQRTVGSTATRIFVTFLETSIPSIALIVGSLVFGSTILNSIPSYGYFFFIILSVLRLNAALCVFTGIVAAVEYAGIVYILRSDLSGNAGLTEIPLVYFQMVKCAAFVAGGVLAGIVASYVRRAVYNSFQLARERNKVLEMFGQHVSPAVVNRLLEQRGEFVNESRSVCVMFVDVRNFTAFSECHSAEEVVEYLNRLFEMMIECVNVNDGIVNKFLGDGLLAIFGAPIETGADARNAMNAARAILDKTREMSDVGQIRPTSLGIGIHGGIAVTGHVGSSSRKEYTVIGDVVNVASRIEQLNKEFGSELLVSLPVWNGAGNGNPAVDRVHSVTVKGREESLTVVRVV